MPRVFVARDGDKKPQGWVHASLGMGVPGPGSRRYFKLTAIV